MKKLSHLICSALFAVILMSCGMNVQPARTAAPLRYTYGRLPGSTQTERLYYQEIGGAAIYQGDINLGSANSLDVQRLAFESGARTGIAIDFSRYRWPGGVVPYKLARRLPDPSRVLRAIEEFNTRTSIRLRPKLKSDRNYVLFRRKHGTGVCVSSLGRQFARQTIDLDDRCSYGNVIHEIGHALGLFHEQSRSDRDQNVIIHWENITPGLESQFAQYDAIANDIGAYDFGSIMHYSPFSFSKNGLPTITRLDGTDSGIGQRTALSTNDIQTLSVIYGQDAPGDSAFESDADLEDE